MFHSLNEMAVDDEVVILTANGRQFRYRVASTGLLVANDSSLAEVKASGEDSLLRVTTCVDLSTMEIECA